MLYVTSIRRRSVGVDSEDGGPGLPRGDGLARVDLRRLPPVTHYGERTVFWRGMQHGRLIFAGTAFACC